MEYTQDATQTIETLSLKVAFKPSFSVSSIKDSFETSYCLARFILATEGKWSIAVTSFVFTGNAVLYGDVDASKDTYAGIESSVCYGKPGYPPSQRMGSLYFTEVNQLPFYREMKVAPGKILWSSCDDTLAIDFDSSIIIDSINANRFISITEQKAFFSFKPCEFDI
jgi:hypothetical protein